MPPHDRKVPRVLVVDDEREMAEMLADGLCDRGYEATAAASSEEALARLGEDAFDALVTDLRMPHVDGLALLAEARRATPDLPVIVMTAYGAIDSAIESIRRGASHYLHACWFVPIVGELARRCRAFPHKLMSASRRRAGLECHPPS